MDRSEGIVRWSPNPARDEFMTFNLNNRVLNLYEATGHAEPEKFDYKRVSGHSDIPMVNTYDWSPSHRGLVSVGTIQGVVYILRVDDDSNANIQLPLKLQRSVQSVAFNTAGLLAVGLDRVRNDSCLQIWDVNQRLGDWDPTQPGFNVPQMAIEPKKRLEGSTSISSIRFFDDQPQTLVCGIKGQSVRIHDLRDPNSTAITFQTKCNNNIAIDWLDTNYFASSTLDQPGLVVWDRRAATRSTCSSLYTEAVDEDDVPWGAVLQMKTVIQVENSTFVKQLRYSREERGLLGVLSTAGQLQTLQTQKEFVEKGSSNDLEDSPELLYVRKSWQLERPYFDPDFKRKHEHRIVSFDWLNLNTTDLQPRVIGLRANGEFEIFQMPTITATQMSNMMPWTPPHKSEESYLTLLNFKDPGERQDMLGPLVADSLKTGVAPFGSVRYSMPETQIALVSQVKNALNTGHDLVDDLLTSTDVTTAPHSKKTQAVLTGNMASLNFQDKDGKTISEAEKSVDAPSYQATLSSREMHDKMHYASQKFLPASKTTHAKLDHIIISRAIAGYLFDCKLNMEITSKDPWLKGVWEWIDGAEEAAEEDGMISGPLDLSYMGVFTIWNHWLGSKSDSRIIQGMVTLDESQWEHFIAGINKKNRRPAFTSVKTTKPQHRQLCLAICGLLKTESELNTHLETLMSEGNFTAAAAWALFQGLQERAVDILSSGGQNLVWVSMALDMKLRANVPPQRSQTAWKKSLDENPQVANDPYLRAIYGYLTTGEWATVADETSLPLRHRIGVALRNFSDEKLTAWLETLLVEAVSEGDIEAIVLTGITDVTVDILQKYVEKFEDYQTPILIMSFCYPRYIDDMRCDAWRNGYRDMLNRHKAFMLRVPFDQQTAAKSRKRNGAPTLKQQPRQVTVRCLNCDLNAINDMANSGSGSATASAPLSTTADSRNPLVTTGINSGLSCPRCGSHFPRCAICMEYVGVPRSDRPDLSPDPMTRRMANYPSFCLKCKHAQHMDHAMSWFDRHMECPVSECSCICNEQKRDPDCA